MTAATDSGAAMLAPGRAAEGVWLRHPERDTPPRLRPRLVLWEVGGVNRLWKENAKLINYCSAGVRLGPGAGALLVY